VVLTPAAEKRPLELRARLRTYLQQPRVAMATELADDPSSLADVLMDSSEG
jgi:hypothetical protein